ncbi:MAG TPA: cupin domain-containing protein [Gaiella sp.]|nr:cupin domain-containing protein [Gaiella sp.]
MSTLHRPTRASEEGPAASGRALARCVPDPEAFASAWGRAAIHATAAELPQPFDDLLDLDAVDELLSRRGLRTPFLRMAKDGAVVPASRFTRQGGVGAAVGDQVDEAAVARLFADGTTIVLQALHRIWPPVISFAGQLREDVGHPVQVNAYVTPPASRGFSAHYDIHDVFVLQVAGEKRWIVHEPCFEAPLRSQPWTERRADVERTVVETEPVFDVVLRPGDALYLPRGFIHAAEALGDVCAHLTVGMHVVTRHALVEALAALAVEDIELRRSLPLGLDLDDGEMLAQELRAAVAALVGFVEETEAEPVVGHLREGLAPTARAAPIAPLAQAAAARSVGGATRVRLREGLDARLETSDGVARLEHRTGALALDGSRAAALERLLDGEIHAVESLPGETAEVEELVRTLLRESVVVPVGG